MTPNMALFFLILFMCSLLIGAYEVYKNPIKTWFKSKYNQLFGSYWVTHKWDSKIQLRKEIIELKKKNHNLLKLISVVSNSRRADIQRLIEEINRNKLLQMNINSLELENALLGSKLRILIKKLTSTRTLISVLKLKSNSNLLKSQCITIKRNEPFTLDIVNKGEFEINVVGSVGKVIHARSTNSMPEDTDDKTLLDFEFLDRQNEELNHGWSTYCIGEPFPRT